MFSNDKNWLKTQFQNKKVKILEWVEVIENIDEELISVLPYYGLVFVTPDGVKQNLTIKVVERICKEFNADVIAFFPYFFTKSNIFNIYSGRTTDEPHKARTHSKWLSTKLMQLGTSYIVVFKSTKYVFLQNEISKCKGKSSFKSRTLNDLRNLSSISDRCFSLIHSPDDYEGFINDFLSTLGLGILKRSLKSCEKISTKLIMNIDDQLSLRDELNTYDFIYRLFEKILARTICNPLYHEISIQKYLNNISQIRAKATLETILFDFKLIGQMFNVLLEHILQFFFRKKNDFDINEFNDVLNTIYIYKSVLNICNLSEMKIADSERIIDGMKRINMPLSDYDELRLLNFAYFYND